MTSVYYTIAEGNGLCDYARYLSKCPFGQKQTKLGRLLKSLSNKTQISGNNHCNEEFLFNLLVFMQTSLKGNSENF